MKGKKKKHCHTKEEKTAKKEFKSTEKSTKEADKLYSHFAYDDAYRTMESECNDLLIPFVNYIFHEEYGEETEIVRLQNEHFIGADGQAQKKKVTDSYMEFLEDEGNSRYHIECESGKYDDSLLLKLFEYDTRITVDYFLLPFYVFNLENELDQMEEDADRLERFAQEMDRMLRRLEEEADHKELSGLSYSIVVRLIHQVAHKLTINKEKVNERIDEIMGGKVLDLDVIRAYHEGQEQEAKRTEEERKRAEEERERADRAEKRVKELEAMLALK